MDFHLGMMYPIVYVFHAHVHYEDIDLWRDIT